MIEYNYIYGMLNNYGKYIKEAEQNSEEWKDITTNLTNISNKFFYILSHKSYIYYN